MDIFRDDRMRRRFGSVQGTVLDIMPAAMGGGRSNGCMLFVTLESKEGGIVNCVVSPATYVMDFTAISVGMDCTFWYLADAPMLLIYPPQYNAVVAAQNQDGRFVYVGYFNDALVNEDRTLQLNLDGSVDMRTTNNQYFQGNPANRNLVVTYTSSTRSIPAQTTPSGVVVLCEQ